VVSADVSGISAGDTTANDNQQITISVTAQDDDGTLQISTNDDSTLTLNSCSGAGNCGASIVSGSGTSTVSIDTETDTASGIDMDDQDDILNVSLTLRAHCDNGVETIVVTASQPGSSRSVSISCGGNTGALHLSINKQANFSGGAFPFVYSVSGGSCTVTRGGSTVGTGGSGNFSLADDQTATFDCSAGSVVTVQEDVDSNLVDVDCSDSAGVEEGSRTVRVTANSSDGSVSCTFFNSGVSTVPASIQLSAAQLQPNCGTSTTLSAYVIGSGGVVVPNGTVVNFSATPGLLSSTNATTINGVASVTYTAPANFANLVTIIATSGSASASGQIRVVCAATTVPVAPQAPAPTATPRPATPPPPLLVAPPSAGDGGLLNGSPFSWSLFAAILFVAATAMGISFVTQRDKSE
jgi:hypothetical protein